MSHKLTRLEHPIPAVLMHWAHLLSFFVLIATGLHIMLTPTGSGVDSARCVRCTSSPCTSSCSRPSYASTGRSSVPARPRWAGCSGSGTGSSSA